MHILEEITSFKKRLLNIKKLVISIKDLEQMPLFERDCFALTESVLHSNFGIIAEHKRRSPSRPQINLKTEVFEIAKAYEAAGVSGMSVLTEQKYFGGSLEDLLLCRAACSLPLLRKDFMVDEYQIVEAKAHGADVILLIAACLSNAETKKFSKLAKELGLQSILEVHSRQELEDYYCDYIDVVGVNNRNLKTFEVDLNISHDLIQFMPNDVVKISESGIKDESDIFELKQSGYQGFLLGEHFMKTEKPGVTAQIFIENLSQNYK